MTFRAVAVCLTLSGLAAYAQTANATITGLVSDPAGAVVSGASVEVRHLDTGTVYSATTTATGNYTAQQLPVGKYELNVSVSGFKKFTRRDFELMAAQMMRLDIGLEIGSSAESVTVTGEATLLKTETSAQVHNVTVTQMQNLPILPVNGGGLSSSTSGFRDPYALARLVPGIRYTASSDLAVNGAPDGTFNILIEGQTANATGGSRSTTHQVQPSVDAIQEVAVQTSNYAAEFGTVGGGIFNLTMRSGSSQYHGLLSDYMVNDVMNSAQPYSGLKSAQRRHDYTGNVGGPVYIPKLYSRNRNTFFFFNWNQFRENIDVRNTSATVPLDGYRVGDFSQTIPLSGINNVPRPVQVGGRDYIDPLGRTTLSGTIFDPRTTRTVVCNTATFPNANCTNGSNVQVRDPFPQNQIPQNATTLDPVAQRILALVPRPKGVNFQRGQPSSNYQNPWVSHRTSQIPSVKIDQSIGSKGHASFYWHHTVTESQFSYPNGNSVGLPLPIDPARGTFIYSPTYRFNYDYSLRPTIQLHFGLGYNANNFADNPPVLNYNAEKELGLRGATLNRLFPNITTATIVSTTLGGMSALGPALGINSTGFTEHRPAANANVTWVKNNHTYKLGWDFRLEQYPTITYTNTAGNYTFSSTTNGGGTTQIALQGLVTSQGTTGFGFADFLLGNVSGTTLSVPARYRTQKTQTALFLQDTWKVTRRLTLDYGLRWDYGTYAREQYGRNANFDFNVPNASAGGHPGGSIFEATCKCRFADNYPYAAAPRLGVAWQLNSKTVLRGGFGVVYNATGTAAGSAVTQANGGTVGFGEWLYQLKDGIPSNIAPRWPVFDSNIGQAPGTVVTAPGLLDRNAGRPARQYQWSIGLQREISRNLVVEASYVANRGVWWSTGGAFVTAAITSNNDISEALLAKYGFKVGDPADSVLLRSQWSQLTGAQRALLAARGVNPPYAGFPVSGSNVQTVRQALRPFPQYSPAAGSTSSIIPANAPLGKTWYDAFQMTVTKRLSRGLSLNANYTFSKTLDAMDSPDVFNRALAKNLADSDRPHVFRLSAEYTVPTLRNGVFSNKVASAIFSNWGMGWYVQYQSAATLTRPTSTGSDPISNWLGRGPGPAQLKRNPDGGYMSPWAVNWVDYDGKVHPEPLDINCHCFDPQRTLVLNPNAWENVPNGQWAADFTGLRFFRTFRQPSENVNFSRNFRFKEGRMNFQVRAEWQNAFNRMRLPNPSTTNFQSNPTQAGGVYTGGFGTINPVSMNGLSGMRSGTLIARLQF